MCVGRGVGAPAGALCAYDPPPLLRWAGGRDELYGGRDDDGPLLLNRRPVAGVVVGRRCGLIPRRSGGVGIEGDAVTGVGIIF